MQCVSLTYILTVIQTLVDDVTNVSKTAEFGTKRRVGAIRTYIRL